MGAKRYRAALNLNFESTRRKLDKKYEEYKQFAEKRGDFHEYSFAPAEIKRRRKGKKRGVNGKNKAWWILYHAHMESEQWRWCPLPEKEESK